MRSGHDSTRNLLITRFECPLIGSLCVGFRLIPTDATRKNKVGTIASNIGQLEYMEQLFYRPDLRSIA